MKKIAISAALVSSLLCGSAMAADIYTGKDDTNFFQEGLNEFEGLSYDWSGAYLGIQGGYKTNEVKDFNLKNDESALYNIDMNKFTGGIFVGYNFHFDNNIVLGIEGDVNINNAKDTVESMLKVGKDFHKHTAIIKNKSDVSVRGRVGYAFNHVMPYVSAGLVQSNFSSEGVRPIYDTDGNPSDTETTTWEVKKGKIGYTVGAGLDMATVSNIVLRTEYRYTDFGKFNLGFKDDNKASSHEVRVGVAYKF